MSNLFSASPLTATITKNDKEQLLYKVEFQDIVRAFCGALFFALPLHFTEEMWIRARLIPFSTLVIILVITYLANVGYNLFVGFKKEENRQSIWFDALVAMGIGILASAITMLLIDQVSPQIPFFVTLKIVALIAVPTSLGASLAKNNLGRGGGKDEDMDNSLLSDDARKVTGATLGAIMVSFNIAPTTEPAIVASAIQWQQIIGLIIFSLIVSYAIVFMAGFVEQKEKREGLLRNPYVETVVCYIIALLVCISLLWMFGYCSLDTPPTVSLPWVVVLGYVTTLGASAGRIIL